MSGCSFSTAAAVKWSLSPAASVSVLLFVLKPGQHLMLKQWCAEISITKRTLTIHVLFCVCSESQYLIIVESWVDEVAVLIR